MRKPTPTPNLEPSRADWARAATIALVLFVQLLLAIPSTNKLDPSNLNPSVIATFRKVEDVRTAVLSPFRPLLRLTGTGQAWGMFATPDRNPRRLEIWLQHPDGWTLVFRKNDPKHDIALLHDRRVRALYDGTPDTGSVAFWTFSRWLGKRLLLDDPRATAVRFQLWQVPTTDPWESKSTEETLYLERIYQSVALLDEL